jgi:hypothetical protein
MSLSHVNTTSDLLYVRHVWEEEEEEEEEEKKKNIIFSVSFCHSLD